MAVAAASHPAARIVPWLLERRPLRWIGLRSYSLYLWHWPIFMVTRPGVDLVYDSWVIQLVRFALIALTALLRLPRAAIVAQTRPASAGTARISLWDDVDGNAVLGSPGDVLRAGSVDVKVGVIAALGSTETGVNFPDD